MAFVAICLKGSEVSGTISTIYTQPITGVPVNDETGGTGGYDPGYTVTSDGTIATYTLGADDFIEVESADIYDYGVDVTSASEATVIDTSGSEISIDVTRDIPGTGTDWGQNAGVYASNQSVTLNGDIDVSVTDNNSWYQGTSRTVYGNACGLWADGSGTITVNGNATLFATTPGYSGAILLTGLTAQIIINGNLTAESDCNNTNYEINTSGRTRLIVNGDTTLTATGIWPSDNVNGIWNQSVSGGTDFYGNLALNVAAYGSTAMGIRNNGIVYVQGTASITVFGWRSALGIAAQNRLSETQFGGDVTVNVTGGLNTFGATYGVLNAGYKWSGAYGYMLFQGTLDITAVNGTFEGSCDVYGISNTGLLSITATSGTDVITVTGQKVATGDAGVNSAYGIFNTAVLGISNNVDITVSEDVDAGQSGYVAGLGATYGILNESYLDISGGLTISTGSLSSAATNYAIVTRASAVTSIITMVNQSSSANVEISGDVLTGSSGTYVGTLALNLDTAPSFLEGLVATDTDGSVGKADISLSDGANWIITGSGTAASDFGTGTLDIGSGGTLNMAESWGAFSSSVIPAHSYRTLTIDNTTLDSAGVSLSTGADFTMLSDVNAATADKVIFGAGVTSFSATGTVGISVAYDPILTTLEDNGEATAGMVIDAASPIVIADASAAAGGSATFTAVQGEIGNWTYGTKGDIEYVPIVELSADHQQILLQGIEIVSAVLCLCQGTKLLTPAGEVPVEDIRPGDLVITADGVRPVRWVGYNSYDGRALAGNHLALPICIRSGALADGVPVRDLHVSPGHGIWQEGCLVPAWRLVNGVSIMQATKVESVEYFNVELEEHGLLLAHGVSVESFLDEGDFRSQFQNAAAYWALYPDAPLLRDIMPLPRVERGFKLEAVLTRINQRAGIAPANHGTGPLRGYVDGADQNGNLYGWAQDAAAPEVPVILKVLAGNRFVARVLANAYRADLREAALGSGCHAFELRLPPGCAGDIKVRREIDDAELSWV